MSPQEMLHEHEGQVRRVAGQFYTQYRYLDDAFGYEDFLQEGRLALLGLWRKSRSVRDFKRQSWATLRNRYRNLIRGASRRRVPQVSAYRSLDGTDGETVIDLVESGRELAPLPIMERRERLERFRARLSEIGVVLFDLIRDPTCEISTVMAEMLRARPYRQRYQLSVMRDAAERTGRIDRKTWNRGMAEIKAVAAMGREA